jgi:hypothetical protein
LQKDHASIKKPLALSQGAKYYSLSGGKNLPKSTIVA